ncbi:hypothetical protein N44_02932 [Microcystis aeruginosa NIES-44]|uniref:Uncharacterized protein n=1 Tax=Microcystis aeruginosa NIES-44 TaxID=449439 RepID=A0A0A1VX19_MICAE|nr:hypothetical protein N44_02932 [Microcystis aeruginosa NIES-44]
MGKTLHPTCPPDVGGVGGATPCPQEKLFQQALYRSDQSLCPLCLCGSFHTPAPTNQLFAANPR